MKSRFYWRTECHKTDRGIKYLDPVTELKYSITGIKTDLSGVADLEKCVNSVEDNE